METMQCSQVFNNKHDNESSLMMNDGGKKGIFCPGEENQNLLEIFPGMNTEAMRQPHHICEVTS